MSRLTSALLRLFALDKASRLGRRLERDRPRPDRSYAMQLRRLLAPRWTALSGGSASRLRGLVLIGAGVVLLAVAALVAGS